MEQMNPSLSIITPAYNRGNLLNKCYESLKKQTCYDFEWIVINDGSTDDTENIIKNIKSDEMPFELQYIWKKNGGKHTALNAAHPYIHGKYILILDSDDRLTSNAVETVLNEWKQYEQRSDIGILIFLRENEEHTVCAYVKDEYVPVDLLSYKRENVLSSDCCEVLRTELFKKYPFPVFEGERFLAETALWYRVGLEKSCVYINKAVYICEYLDGGLTKSGRSMRVKNPKGGMYTSFLRMNNRCTWKERLKAGFLYICYGHYAKIRAALMIKKSAPHQILTIMCYLPGTIMYWIWRKEYR